MEYCKDCKHFETIISNGEETSFCNDEIYHRAGVHSDSKACETFVPIDCKDLFWRWLKENTNFVVFRKHHKKDIEDALDYIISKLPLKD
jgi:hypothetical protein